MLILNILPVIIDVLEAHKGNAALQAAEVSAFSTEPFLKSASKTTCIHTRSPSPWLHCVASDHADVILFACWAIVELAVTNEPKGRSFSFRHTHTYTQTHFSLSLSVCLSLSLSISLDLTPPHTSYDVLCRRVWRFVVISSAGGTEFDVLQEDDEGAGEGDGGGDDRNAATGGTAEAIPSRLHAPLDNNGSSTDNNGGSDSSDGNRSSSSGGDKLSAEDALEREVESDIAKQGLSSTRQTSSSSLFGSRRVSVVSGPFEGPTTYEPDDDAGLDVHDDAFDEVIVSILKNMKKHKDNADVHRYGTLALENLASRSGGARACGIVAGGAGRCGVMGWDVCACVCACVCLPLCVCMCACVCHSPSNSHPAPSSAPLRPTHHSTPIAGSWA